MAPKSGHRFSEKAMRQKKAQKKNGGVSPAVQSVLIVRLD